MIPLVHTHELKNGIRLIHQPNNSEVAHFGLIVHTGTRDEYQDEHGLAHFMEHMFFKGTQKRSAFQIISRIEDVGGEINAYTTKEETAIYASFLRQDYRRAIELIQDIFLHTRFSEKERSKEAEVILNEIRSYDDSPSELIFDKAEELLFPDHPIGRNILGSEETLNLFRNGALERFLYENYATDEIVLSSIGNVPFERIKNTVEKYFSDILPKHRQRERVSPAPAFAKKMIEKRNSNQKHCMMVGEAYALPDQKRLQLYLLNNILGGPGMNSRLNLALRERRGFSYSAESHFAPYTDTGVMMIYFSCDPEKFQQSIQVIGHEIKKLQSKLITEKRMSHARKQLVGQLAISYENNEHRMLTAGKSYLVFNMVEGLDAIRKKLEDISPNQLRETANEVINQENLNMIIFE